MQLHDVAKGTSHDSYEATHEHCIVELQWELVKARIIDPIEAL
jgi:hypothetical protein